MTDCIFCAIADGKIPSKRVYEDEDTIAFEDINPAAPVHILVIPRVHVDTLDAIPAGDERVLGRLIGVARDLARERELVESGYRLIVNVGAGAGQSVFHVHLHLLGGRRFTWPPG